MEKIKEQVNKHFDKSWKCFIPILVFSYIIGVFILQVTGYTGVITADNKGDYISVFSIHCSVVFLSTSLMTMLSVGEKYVYWVDIVKRKLIDSGVLSFRNLSNCAIFTVFLSAFGFVFKLGGIMIGAISVGIILIVIIFCNMVAVYYVNSFLVEDIKKQFEEMVMRGDEGYDDCVEIIDVLKTRNFLATEKWDFSVVKDNLELLENTIQKLEGLDESNSQNKYENVKKLLSDNYNDMFLELCSRYPVQGYSFLVSQPNLRRDDSIYKKCILSLCRVERKDLFVKSICILANQLNDEKLKDEETKSFFENIFIQHSECVLELYKNIFAFGNDDNNADDRLKVLLIDILREFHNSKKTENWEINGKLKKIIISDLKDKNWNDNISKYSSVEVFTMFVEIRDTERGSGCEEFAKYFNGVIEKEKENNDRWQKDFICKVLESIENYRKEDELSILSELATIIYSEESIFDEECKRIYYDKCKDKDIRKSGFTSYCKKMKSERC